MRRPEPCESGVREGVPLFKTIMVPTDLQEKSRKALDVSVRLALREQSDILLLHVIETIDDAEEGEFDAFYEKLRKRAMEKMNDMAARYANQEVRIQRHIVLGKRAREIVAFARDKDVDLIVLSSHRIDRTDPAVGWATISYRVAILAPCHVMMVK